MTKIVRVVVLLQALIGLYFVGTLVSGFLPGGREAPAASVQEARLGSGEAWNAMLDELRIAGEEVRDSPLSISRREQAEGYRHLLRMVAVFVESFIDGSETGVGVDTLGLSATGADDGCVAT